MGSLHILDALIRDGEYLPLALAFAAGAPAATAEDYAKHPVATVRVRYKDPDTGRVTELEQRVTDANSIANFAG